MMVKKIIFTGGLILVLALAACAAPEAGVESSAVAGSSAGQSGSGLSADFADAMPIASQLAAGTVVLENGENAVTAEQAATLLPLWQAYSGLVANGSTAQAELDGLVSQIEKGMTAAQISEIASLRLTNSTLTDMIAAGDIQLGRGGFGGRGQAAAGQDAGGQGGGPPDGGGGGGGRGQGGLGGGGGQGGGGIGGLSPDDLATRQAQRVEQAGGEGAFLTAQVSSAVVQLLDVKVNGEPVRQGGGNLFALANEAVAAELGMSAEDLSAATAAGQTVQEVIEENGGDLEAIKVIIADALVETDQAQNGDVDRLIENYLSGTGGGRGNGGQNAGNDG